MKRKRLAVLGLCATLAFSMLAQGGSSFVHAETKSYQAEIDAAKEKKEQLEKERKELEAKITELNKQKADMNAYIENMDKQYMELTASIEELEADITEKEEHLESTRELLSQVKQQEQEQYETMKRRIRYLYENGETGFLDILVGEGTLTDMLNEMEYRKAITEYDNSLLERYQQTKQQVQETESLLLAQLDELNELKVSREFELAAVEELMAAKTAELEALAASIGVDEEMLFLYWEEIVTMGEDIEELERKEAERVAEEERKRKEEEERLKREAEERARKKQADASLSSSVNIENMLWPVPNSGKVTSEFGYRNAPVAGASTFHQAIDIGVGSLSRSERGVVAALAGTVTDTGYTISTGNYVIIDHGNGLVTKYYHAYQVYVKKGQKVERGEEIMEAGNTGYSSGPHLHFGVFVNGVAVDPLLYIDYSDWQ